MQELAQNHAIPALMLNISIVLYAPRWEEEVLPLLHELVRVQYLNTIYLIDNSPLPTKQETWNIHSKIHYIFTQRNLGYGRAHNIALRESIYNNVPYHLVLNADIQVRAEDIDNIHSFMDANPLVGQLMPRVVYPNGETQHLCKLLPTPWDVFGRRFLPSSLMAKRNARYELHASGYNRPMNVPYLSGCFMFLRTQAAHQAHLFDERYFLYPEDIDLTRTIHRNYLTLYYPAVTIVHNHGQASYKSLHMLWVHIVNMCRYFNKWGWCFDKERKAFNRQLLDDLGLSKR